jgi:hypothetical protein
VFKAVSKLPEPAAYHDASHPDFSFGRLLIRILQNAATWMAARLARYDSWRSRSTNFKEFRIMPDPTLKNVFEAILKYGHDEDFAPKQDEAFKATQAPAGTREKLEVLADRVRRGQPLWHDDDRADYSGLTGAIRPRD